MATKTASPEQNVATMRRFVTEVQQTGDTSKIDEIIHPDFTDHREEGPVRVGLDGVRAVLAGLHATFTEVQIEVIDCIGQGNVVATNKVITGKHVAEFRSHPPTEQRTSIPVMDFVRFEDGLFREHWATLGPLRIVKEQ